jgi:hypothetical protein
MSRDFFERLQPLPDFRQMIESQLFADLPADWVVMLTDVKDSTKAIEAGNYKAVNLVGASCIMAVQNALPDVDFPYVFDGDGATLAVPAADAPAAARALSHIRGIARRDFRLELRIAVIKASDILATGARLRVGKLRISPIQHLAQLAGEGWSKAESWMKEREAEFSLAENHEAEGDMTGLECRWSPLPARKEEILALIVQARGSGESATGVYREILAEVLDPGMKPIIISKLNLHWPPPFLAHEVKMRAQGFFNRLVYLAKAGAISVGHVIFMAWRGAKRNLSDPIQYLRELAESSDYVKFNEALRMILDVSKEEKERILAKLDAHHRKGEIYYGHHANRCALLTCYIRGPQRHIHFVDADGGGYAMAAKQLKAQRNPLR